MKNSSRFYPRNPLKSINSDEKIQGNPRKSNPHNRGSSQRNGDEPRNPNRSTGLNVAVSAGKEPNQLQPNARQPKPPQTAPAGGPAPPIAPGPPAPARERALAGEPALGPGQAFPASSARGVAIGGNKPKLTFIGWNERGPASIDSIWPPVIWLEARRLRLLAAARRAQVPDVAARGGRR